MILVTVLSSVCQLSFASAKDGEATVYEGESTTISISSGYWSTLARATGINYRWYSADSDVSVTSSSKTSCTIRGNRATTSGRVYYYCSYYIDGFYRTMDFYYTITVKSKTVYVTGVYLSDSDISLDVGEGQQLTASVYPSNATNRTVSWTSSNSNIASVSNGYVYAKSSGTATITCKATDGSGCSATCYVRVTNPVVYVSSISLDYTSLTLDVGSGRQLTATVYPINATNRSVSWSSSKSSVATVSNGYVSAISEGTATITCRATDGSGEYATCNVQVKGTEVKVTSISLNESSWKMKVGDTKQLTASVYPSNATNRNVNWSTSNSSVATVSNGLVTANAAGTATITCRASDGSGIFATCNLTIEEETAILVTDIFLDTYTITAPVGTEHEFKLAILPVNATNQDVKWTSTNSNVAWITQNGYLYIDQEGTAVITCMATDGSNVYAQCEITATPSPTPYITTNEVVCDNTDLEHLTYNDKLTFHAKFSNTGATDDVYSAIVICDENLNKIIRISEFDLRTFEKNKSVTIDYELSLKGLPKGNYVATVMYYDHWKYNSYFYSESFLKKITIVDDGDFKKGDVNLDGKVDISDIVAVINFIAGTDSFYFCDVNEDGSTDISDIVAIINIIAGTE
ncbi:MAG: Ig-like domain-containing protein [Bacteroidaceae bacterium]|nr:Ig-like domain-containing protein [Bacteroidaceae bacterium]